MGADDLRARVMFRTTSRTFCVSASAAVLVCVAATLAEAATVSGNVVDSTTSLPLSGVEVLVDGVPSGVTTDLMGQFKAEVGEGERLFTFKRTGFSEQSIGPVTVTAEGETAVPPAKLAPDSANDIVMLDALDVTGELVKGGTGDLQNVRQKADVAIDFLSADQLSKFSAGDLSEAIIRIPGVSVSGGQFAVVRGLSDRFLTTTIHGLKLPSPDPEKQAFQMDLLPSSAIGNIVVAKTFGPELWGESGGGNIDITTNNLPEENYTKFSAGVKYNDNNSDGGLDYSLVGSERRERFGYGANYRPAVGSTPRTWQYVPSRNADLPLGNEFALEFGRTFAFSEEKKLGWRFAAENETGVKTKSGLRTLTNLNVFDPALTRDAAPVSVRSYEETESESVTTLNTTLGFDFSENHSIKLDAIYVQSGIDVAYLEHDVIELGPNLTLVPVGGGDGTGNGAYAPSILFQGNEYYKERNLTVFQLSGKHEFPELSDLKLSWAGQSAEVFQNDSPFIETVFQSDLSNPFAAYQISGNNAAPIPLLLNWANNEESQQAFRLDGTLPFDLSGERESELKAGVAFDHAERTVAGRTVFFDERSVSASNTTTLFENFLAPGGTKLFDSPVSVDSTREIDAAYLGTNLSFTSWVRVVGGGRFESAELSTSGWARWNTLTTNNLYSHPEYGRILGTLGLPGSVTNSDLREPVIVEGNYARDEVLPALGVIFEPTKTTTVRLAFSETRGRPSVRELSPFFSKSIDTGNVVVGNPSLTASEVMNYDLRFEYNPQPDQGLALSFFYKEISNPIEKIALQTSEVGTLDTWVNNPSAAEMQGLEFEFRHGLGYWSYSLAEFSVTGNLTLIDAEVGENPFVLEVLDDVPTKRRLFDQPEYIANLDLTWRREKWGSSATFSVYAISDVLNTAGLSSELGPGGDARPDLYTRGYSRFDLVLSQRISANFKVKFSVKNLFDPELGTIYDRERHGREIPYNTYRAGRSFSLSVTGEF